MQLCCCKDPMIKRFFGDFMFCTLECSLFLNSGLSIVQIYLTPKRPRVFLIKIAPIENKVNCAKLGPLLVL
jgi:hypothetical protein